MSKKDIVFEKADGIATITLNRPDSKNAFTVDMIDEWSAALEEWRKDPDVRVIILTGSGDAFCAGIDFSSIDADRIANPVGLKKILWERIHRIPLALEDLDKPVIAAVNGVAVGAGLDMALMCDLRFASDAARFSEGYVKVGLVPGDGGAYYLPRLVGIAKALELLWTGDFIDAPEAMRIGLINRVYPQPRLMQETYTFARQLADGPTEVIRTIKRATYQSSRIDLRTALDLISSHMGIVRQTQDSQEAMKKALGRFGGEKDTSERT